MALRNTLNSTINTLKDLRDRDDHNPSLVVVIKTNTSTSSAQNPLPAPPPEDSSDSESSDTVVLLPKYCRGGKDLLGALKQADILCAGMAEESRLSPEIQITEAERERRLAGALKRAKEFKLSRERPAAEAEQKRVEEIERRRGRNRGSAGEKPTGVTKASGGRKGVTQSGCRLPLLSSLVCCEDDAEDCIAFGTRLQQTIANVQEISNEMSELSKKLGVMETKLNAELNVLKEVSESVDVLKWIIG
ncbi:hypothetical protein L873DRAFT_837984 [Choiromyces venosus 120613-1]|uniref:Uncharacterized protein n=1 Tax=Choiromyces venosus 120613-1 TaxID=1336337 RepID=A0A3N4JPI3_9PEZI|nr:hypothetical protein L873DRAFT_837984 [Choiromyces venosus 120613-1]